MTQLISLAVVAALLAWQPVGTISPGGIQSIGPKQDDPLTMCDPGQEKSGIIVQGGREAIGPKQDDPRKLAIGPKQDDPRSPVLAIGPKQDDPRSRTLAIGPKQDDPRSSASAVSTYDPETDPQAAGRNCVKKKKD